MLEEGKITNRQLSLLLATTTVLATAVLFAPAITAAAAKQDAWISLLVVATAYGLLVASVAVNLGRRFPGKTVAEYAPLILGAFFGKLAVAGFLLWIIHINAVIIREFGDFLLSAFMPETPLIAFNIVLVALAALGVKYGLEVICRANEFAFLVFFLSLIAIFLLVLPDADFSNLLPVLENGFKPVIEGGMAPAGFRGEIVLILMFFPYLTEPKKAGIYLASTVLLIGVILTLATVMTTAVMGGLAQYLAFPFFALARYIAIGEFLERLEALVLVMWVAGVTIKAAVFYYAAVLGTAQLFGLRDYRPVIIPMGFVLAVWSLNLFENTRQMVEWITTIFPPYAYTFELVFPALLLLVAVLRKKGGTGGGS